MAGRKARTLHLCNDALPPSPIFGALDLTELAPLNLKFPNLGLSLGLIILNSREDVYLFDKDCEVTEQFTQSTDEIYIL